MKAVILAAGKGTRMGSLAIDLPKPLLKIGDKTLLELKMDVLPAECTEIVIVLGYLGDKIKEHFGDTYKDKILSYVNSKPLGTAYSLWQAKEYLKEPFIVMNGDDLYARKDIEECIKYHYSALVTKTNGFQSGGKAVIKGNFIEDVAEGSHPPGTTILTGLYVLSPEIFKLELVKIPKRNEFGLPQTLMSFKLGNMRAVPATAWHQITTPEDLKISEEQLALFK